MDKVWEIKSKYGNESGTSTYDRFSDEHWRNIVKNVDASVADDVLRMARAFPTYKLYFIEEDQSTVAKDDDLYGYSSVNSIVIHKSREQAADTAIISLTNFLGHLDSHDFKAKDHADSTEETSDKFKRKTQETFETMKVRPGTRIQLKLGYTSFANDLENVFTGKITEVKYGDEVVITAQGYGVELLEPLGYSYWGTKERSLWANPRRLVISMLKTRPVKHLGRWRWSNRNRYASKSGWVRLDNPVDDNIMLETGNWWSSPNKWCTDFHIYHENAWGVIQDLQRRFPGYVARVEPFDERGTLFFGLPDSMYFYTETPDIVNRRIYQSTRPKLEKGETDLNQKMFRQYHLKTSENHIIANNIKIDLSNFYNRVTVRFNKNTHKRNQSLVKEEGEKHVTVMADDTIEQEYWRTKVVYEENCENKEQAYLYGLGNLLLCTQTLYSGELIVLGDPKIKPHDVVLIYDNYTGMYGPIGVREVVHNFNREEGFTTTIVPDLMIYINVPIAHMMTTFGAYKAGLMSALSWAGIQAVSNVILPGSAGAAYPIFSARLGWSSQARQPLGIQPLIYDGKPYLAGFEGMKYDNLITRTVAGWKKGTREFFRGLSEAGFRIQEGIRRSLYR
jgi:hypothetical protein